mmetsp:Transcript_18723/g.20820  ORF Transcript_18723/g.20820 Transcript_18723/m.20820 type:complete len:145 (-) Transcript_18723:59-493(-)
MNLQELQASPAYAQYAFVFHEDVRQIPEFMGASLLGVKAPPGTKMEVPIPENGEKKYQVTLTGKLPVDVIVVSKIDDELMEDAEMYATGCSETSETVNPGLLSYPRDRLSSMSDYYLGMYGADEGVADYYGESEGFDIGSMLSL